MGNIEASIEIYRLSRDLWDLKASIGVKRNLYGYLGIYYDLLGSMGI